MNSLRMEERLPAGQRALCWSVAAGLHALLLLLRAPMGPGLLGMGKAAPPLVSIEYLREAPSFSLTEQVANSSSPKGSSLSAPSSPLSALFETLAKNLTPRSETKKPLETALAVTDPTALKTEPVSPPAVKNALVDKNLKQLQKARQEAKALVREENVLPRTPPSSVVPRSDNLEDKIQQEIKKSLALQESSENFPASQPTGQTSSPGISTYQIIGPLSKRDILRQELPAYPRWAEEQGIDAKVVISFTVLANGRVKDNATVQLTSGSTALDELAVKSLKNWLFAPLDGLSLQEEQTAAITFRFALFERRPEKVEQERVARSQEFYRQGLEAYMRGNISEAIMLWEKTLSLNPLHQQAKRGLERIQGKQP